MTLKGESNRSFRLTCSQEEWLTENYGFNFPPIGQRRRKGRRNLTNEIGRFCRRTMRRFRALIGCESCKEKNPLLLEWHHIIPTQKSGFILTIDKRLNTMLIEATKCKVLCRNCHAIEHWKMAGEPDVLGTDFHWAHSN